MNRINNIVLVHGFWADGSSYNQITAQLLAGSSRLCVIIFAYRIVKCLLGKTFRTILLKKLSV